MPSDDLEAYFALTGAISRSAFSFIVLNMSLWPAETGSRLWLHFTQPCYHVFSLCAQLSQLLVGCRKREDKESSKSNLRHAHLGPSAEARMITPVCILPHRFWERCRYFSISQGCDPTYFDFSHFCDVSVMLSSAGKNACVPCLFDKESSIKTPGSNTFLLPECIGREPFPS